MLANLNLRDFHVLSELSHHSSLRALSRSMKIQPQHLSKLIAGLEKKCGIKLLHRSPKGISLTPEALRFAAFGSSIMESIQNFSRDYPNEEKRKPRSFTLVSRVFMNVCFAPVFTNLLEREFSQFRLRMVDASPKKKELWAREGLVDFVLSLDELDLGKSWQGENVGQICWTFFGRSGHPLGKCPKRDRLIQYPYVAHSHVDGTRLVENIQSHPYKWKFKSISSSTETALSTMRIVERSDAVAFLPDLLVRELNPNLLQQFEISGVEPYVQQVFLYAHLDRVPNFLYRMMLQECKRALRN